MWFKKSAEQGDRESSRRLSASFYEDGRAIKQLAEQGDVQAQYDFATRLYDYFSSEYNANWEKSTP